MSLIVMNKKLISEGISVVFLCLLLAAPVLAGTIPGLTNENSQEKFFRLGEEYRLSEGEIKILQGKALKGSPEAADRLYLYYELDRRDNTETLFWEKIAAENGSPKGQYNLGLRLSKRSRFKKSSKSHFLAGRRRGERDKACSERRIGSKSVLRQIMKIRSHNSGTSSRI